MTTAARQHSHPALKETDRSRLVERKLARLRHIHPPSHTQHLALVEEVRAGRRSKYMRDRLPACLPHLRAFALSLTRDPVRSDDLVQNTLLRAWANLDHFQHDTNLEAWLFTILRNCFYSEFRKYRWEVEDPDDGYARRLMVQPEQEFRMFLDDVQRALEGTANLAPRRQSCRGRRRHASTHQPTRATPVASRQVRKARSRAARYSLAERR